MSSRARILAAVVALVGVPAGAAVAARVPVGAPGPMYFSGSDSQGTVAFTVFSEPKVTVEQFRFATSCWPSTTRLRAVLKVDAHHRFSFTGPSGISVSGSLHGPGQTVASGVARWRTTNCDSGPLAFTARAS
jgi:hypothetical protein